MVEVSIPAGADAGASPSPLRLRRMLRAKIHRVTVTGAELHYEGSLSLDPRLLKTAGLLAFEQVDVVNVNNGARFSTYLIEGAAGECCLNGAAARLGVPGDLLIVMAFDLVEERAALDHVPVVVHVDGDNQPTAGP